MASFSKEVEEMSLQSYDSVVSLYKMIVMLSNNLGLLKPKVKGEFLIKLGKITCRCGDYEEFVEIAYGADNFDLLSINFRIIDENTTVIYLHCIGRGPVSVHAESRIVLETFFTEFDKLQSAVQNHANGVTQNIIDSVVINGDGNTVANNNSSVEVETKQEDSAARSFWTGILQNITSNFLWYLLTLAVGAFVTYFVMK